MSSDTLENCSLSASSDEIIEKKPLKKSTQNEEQQTVVNVYSRNDPEKVDKLVQTGSSSTSFRRGGLFNQRSITKIKQGSANTIIEDTEDCEQPKQTVKIKEEVKKKYSPLTKPLLLLATSENRANKSMEPRRCSKGTVNSKTSPDLTRKKLEAELKAAEEIAKLKENVIEKRLALELASLEDSVDCMPSKKLSSTPPSPLFEKKCMEEPPRKMVPTPQDVIAQEREMCYKYAFNPTRPIMPPTSGCSRQLSPMAIKIPRTDSTSSVLAAFRSITDKKFNIDKKFGAFNDEVVKCPSPAPLPTPLPTALPTFRDFNCIDSGCEMAKRHTEYHQNETMKVGNDSRGRARMVWKSAVMKIKNKIRPKTPPA